MEEAKSAESYRGPNGMFLVEDMETGARYAMRDLPSLYPNSNFRVIEPVGDPAINAELGGGLDDQGNPLELTGEVADLVAAALAEEPELDPELAALEVTPHGSKRTKRS